MCRVMRTQVDGAMQVCFLVAVVLILAFSIFSMAAVAAAEPLL